MKVSHFIITCAVLVLGALYGRFQYLRDKGVISEEADFITYLSGAAESKQPEDEKEEPSSEVTEKGATESSPETGKEKRSGGDPNEEKDSGAKTGVLISQAGKSLQEGDYQKCLSLLKGLKSTRAAKVRSRALLFKQLVKSVDVDPGAYQKEIYEIRLVNGNTLYAVKVNDQGDSLAFLHANGIKGALPKSQIKAWKKMDGEPFHEKRKEKLRNRLKRFHSKGGVYERCKGVRLAWRRGFPKIAAKEYEDLLATPRAIRVLSVAMPSSEATRMSLAMKTGKEQKQSTQKSTPSESTETKKKSQPVPPPAELPTSTQRPSGSAFGSIDAKIKKAQDYIRSAFRKEGREADKQVQKAGKLLAQARKELTGSPDLPKGKAYQMRLERVTLLLEDFLKMSGFGTAGPGQ